MPPRKAKPSTKRKQSPSAKKAQKKAAADNASPSELSKMLDQVEIVLGIHESTTKEITDPSSSAYRLLSPELADLELTRVTRLGRREKFARAHDWENLLPMINHGEELLWIARKESSRFHFHLGLKRNQETLDYPLAVRDRRRQFNSTLSHFSRRAFPESRHTPLDLAEVRKEVNAVLPSGNSVTLVSGNPSPKAVEEDQLYASREESVRLFSSLNDVLEPFIEEDPFSIVFSVARASNSEINVAINRLTDLIDLLHPYLEEQKTTNQSLTTGKQNSRARGTSVGKAEQEQFNIGRKICSFFAGTHEVPTESGFSASPRKKYTSSGSNVSENLSLTDTYGTNSSEQVGASTTFTSVNSRFRLIHEAAERLLKHLKQTTGTGGFFVTAAIYAETDSLAQKIGQALSGALSGSDTHVRPFQVVTYRGEGYDAVLNRITPISHFFPGTALLSNAQASQFLMVPEADMPGISIKQNVFYGQTDLAKTDHLMGAAIGTAAYLQNTEFGEESKTISIPNKDLLSHLLVTGTTGSGKTVRSTQILNGLDPDQFRLIVIETAKKTYRNRLNREGADPQILTVGRSDQSPLRINPFYFDEGTSLKRHISVLSDALSDLLPVEALIGPKMREAITECYFKLGWDLESSTYEGEGPPAYPSMIDFNAEIIQICDNLQYGPELTQNYMGALTGRSKLFIDDVYQDIFSAEGNQSFEKLFDRDTIIELDELPPSEVQMPSFLLSILIERLRAFKSSGIEAQGPRYWILVLEEAHNLLGKKLESQGRGNEMGTGSRLLEQTVRLLQEGRELGIGVFVIDQSPQSLADGVIKNTNTKIIHRMIDVEEASVIGKSIGLEEDEWPDLAELEDGECVLKTKSAGKATKLAPYDADTLREMNLQRESPQNQQLPRYQFARRALETIAGGQQSTTAYLDLADQFVSALHGDVERCDFVIGRYALEQRNLERSLIQARSDSIPSVIRKLFRITAGIDAATFTGLLLMDNLAGISISQVSRDRLASIFGQSWLRTGIASFLEPDFSDGTESDDPLLSKSRERILQWVENYEAEEGEYSLSSIFRLPLKNTQTNRLLLTHLLKPDLERADKKEFLIYAKAQQWEPLTQLYLRRFKGAADHPMIPELFAQLLVYELARSGQTESLDTQSQSFRNWLKSHHL